MQKRSRATALEATLGYAADRRGAGIAYARLRTAGGERLLRVSFTVQRCSGLGDREVGYGALTALATLLTERGAENVTFKLHDEQLLADVQNRLDVPAPLVLPYVRLGCALNRLHSYSMVRSEPDADLAQRARAEVAFHEAA